MNVFNSAHIILSFLFLISFSSFSSAGDSLSPHQLIKDGDTLVSPERTFVLGFFGPGKSKNRYFGMWYVLSNKTFVWVANRQIPITDSSGILMITSSGNLTLVQNQTNKIVWSSNTSNVRNPKAQLLESGNLIVKGFNGHDPKKDIMILWQSFDHPTDTLLPGMKLGVDLRTGQNRFLTSWKTSDDPSLGDHNYIMDARGSHEVYVKTNNNIAYRLGPWNGIGFSGNTRMKIYEMLFFKFVSNETDAYYTFGYTGKGVMSRLLIHTYGKVERLGWSDLSPKWTNYWTAPIDNCDSYGICGANSICDSDYPRMCQCLRGFIPNSATAWRYRDFQMGCKYTMKSYCQNGEGFVLVKGVKLPDTSNSTIDRTINLSDCFNECLKNCSCTAYSAADISGDNVSGCIMWYDDLIDIKKFDVDGQNMYLRVPASELKHHKGKNNVFRIVIPIIIILGITSGIVVFLLKRKKLKRMQRQKKKEHEGINMMTLSFYDDSSKWNNEPKLFDISTIASATNNFSCNNKIGEGGFGSIYKGTMDDGQVIAVKRLYNASMQGLCEFKNEVMLIAQLQHRNLIHLIGYCMEEEEKILIFDFMQNKSLDLIIFGENKHMLDWRKRVEIILGIAKGLLYLHHDSTHKIIHRDLKTANILLDEFMNPKITDFGTARLFGVDQTEENTRKIIGTYGYMSPEYAINGIFSTKSDVFSFGVLLLEIISGKKNRMVCRDNLESNLLDLAWRLFKNGKGFELVDECLIHSCSISISQAIHFIQIGLLCVQECALDRPTMSSVVFMLSNENSSLPEPKRLEISKGNIWSYEKVSCSNNDVSFTTQEYR